MVPDYPSSPTARNIAAANRDIIKRRGPWTATDIELAPGLWSRPEASVDIGDARLRQILQTMAALDSCPSLPTTPEHGPFVAYPFQRPVLGRSPWRAWYDYYHLRLVDRLPEAVHDRARAIKQRGYGQCPKTKHR